MSEKAATIKEIAEKAGVSIGTIDRVLHNRADVSIETREKVLKILKQYRYQANIYASNLVRNKKYNFAFVIPNSAYTAYWQAPIRGFSRAVNELQIFGITSKGYYFDQTDVYSFDKECEEAINDKPDGIVLAPFFPKQALAFIKKCHHKNIPVVLIDSNIEASPSVAYFGQDAFQSGFLAGKLLSLSIPNNAPICIINILKKAETNVLFEKRIEGFNAYFKTNEMAVSPLIIEGLETTKFSVETILKKESDLINKSSGIFVPHSKADEICAFLEKSNIKDKRLVTYDLTSKNIAFLKKDFITFLINQKPEEQAYKAIQTLYEVAVLKHCTVSSAPFPIEILIKENYNYYVNLWQDQ